MSDVKKKNGAQGKALETFLINLVHIAWLALKVSWHGLKRTVFKTVDRILIMLIVYVSVAILVYWHWTHLLILNWCLPGVFTYNVVRCFALHVSRPIQVVIFAGFPTVGLGLILGIGHFLKLLQFQSDLKHIGLASAKGLEPRVVDIEDNGEFRRKVTLVSQGVGLEQYKSKKSDLESAFGAIVEDVRVSTKNRMLMEIYLADKELRTLVGYQECTLALTEPYSFLVGESFSGVLSQSIRSLPHLLVAGTSGNGKSVFFNQALISMMKTSPHIQLYLLDLKLGVEVKAYRKLPNARIAKDATEAVALLRAVVIEMKARFQLLEQNGRKQIDPEMDQKDLILVGIDEASVLYGKRKGDRSGNDMTNEARELTDEIAKLGRAACIHLIIATQKVTNESIDTKIQENVGGRICFRVNTLQGSNTVLGNKKAYELPDIKGRAIWASGNNFTEVQTPFVSEKVITDEIASIKDDFDSAKRKCLQAMIADQHRPVKMAEAQDRAVDSDVQTEP